MAEPVTGRSKSALHVPGGLPTPMSPVGTIKSSDGELLRGRGHSSLTLCCVLLIVSGAVLLQGQCGTSLHSVQDSSPAVYSRRLTRPTSRRHDAPASCDLCSENWLFVLAAGGRTGSTSALSMFSSVPAFEILGEHKGFLRSHMETVEVLRQAMEFWTSDENSWKPAWKHSDLDLQSVLCSVQDLARRVMFGSRYGHHPSPTVLGFKEIRYTDSEMLPFLAAAFPCARFVFTLREQPLDPNVEEEDWVQYEPLQQKAEFVKTVHSKFNGTITALLPLETRSVEDYNEILHGMLGVKGCRFTRSLHDNAEGGYAADQSSMDVVEGECDLSQVNFRLDEQTLQRNAAVWAEIRQSGSAPRDDGSMVDTS